MEPKCKACGGELSTSQITIPVRRNGKLVYQEQRRCKECFNANIISESTTPPFYKRKTCKCKKARCDLKTTIEDGY